MQRHDRHLDRERQRERGQQHRLHRQRQLGAVEVGEGEGRDAGRLVQRVDEVDHRGQHQDAAECRVQHELERGVDAALAAPDPDDQEHRDHHRFPEQVEQEQILRQERALHRELDEEHHRVEELHVLVDGRERTRHDQRAQECGQHHQQQVHPVEADVVVHAPVGNPRRTAFRIAGLPPSHRTVRRARRRARTAAIITPSDTRRTRSSLRTGTAASSSDADERQIQDQVQQRRRQPWRQLHASEATMPKSTSSAYRCRLPFCTRPSTPAVRRAERREPVQRAVEDRLIAELQEDAIRNPVQRTPDQRSRRPRRRSTCRRARGAVSAKRRYSAFGARAVAAVQVRGQRKSGEARCAIETTRSGVSKCSSAGARSGSGNSGSRIVRQRAGSRRSRTARPARSARRSSTPAIRARGARLPASSASAPKNVSHSKRNM